MVELPLVEPGNWLEEPNKFFDDYCRGRKIIRKFKRERVKLDILPSALQLTTSTRVILQYPYGYHTSNRQNLTLMVPMSHIMVPTSHMIVLIIFIYYLN